MACFGNFGMRGRVIAEEVGDVLHTAPAADVLKVDRGDASTSRCKAKVRDLGVAVDQGLCLGAPESRVEDRSRCAQIFVGDSPQFVAPGIEVPVGPRAPQPLGFRPDESSVKTGEPAQAAIDLVRSENAPSLSIAGCIQILEQEAPPFAALFAMEQLRDATGLVTELREAPVPRGLHVIRATLASVGARIASMLEGRRVHRFDDGARHVGALQVDSKNLAVAAPQRLDALAELHAAGASGSCDPAEITIHRDALYYG